MVENAQTQYAPLAVASQILDLLNGLHLSESERILAVKIAEQLVNDNFEKREIISISP